MKKRISTLLCLLALAMTSMQAKDYNVKDFGAIGNGKVLDHHAINTAIDSCVAHGGGRVVLPAGTYLCGSIRIEKPCGTASDGRFQDSRSSGFDESL